MDARRNKTYIVTVSGTVFYPFAPIAQDIHLGDIATALSNIPRWGGHSQKWHSVAEHCVAAAQAAANLYPGAWVAKAWALLHDAAEAYIGDIPTPVKRHLTVGQESIHEAEHHILMAVAHRFHLPESIPTGIWDIDRALLAIEWRERKLPDDLLGTAIPDDRVLCACPRPYYWDRATARQQFLAMADILGIK